MALEYFTGIGSRVLTGSEHDLLIDVSYHCASLGLVLRSGHAEGADFAFEAGYNDAYRDGLITEQAEIFLPWRGFNKELNFKYSSQYLVLDDLGPEWLAAVELLGQIKVIEGSSRGVVRLHTRNMFQPLGTELVNPSKFLLACAPSSRDNATRGGTRIAWKLAEFYGIPCFNIRGKTLSEVESFIQSVL